MEGRRDTQSRPGRVERLDTTSGSGEFRQIVPLVGAPSLGKIEQVTQLLGVPWIVSNAPNCVERKNNYGACPVGRWHESASYPDLLTACPKRFESVLWLG